MGVRYLTKFIMEKRKLYSVEVDTESQPVPAIIDGFSLFYSLSDILLGRGVEHVFSYTSIRNEIFRFMDYVTAKEIDIQCICRDTLIDYDKLDTFAERGENNQTSILKSWKTDFKQRPHSFLPYYTSIMMMDALDEYSHGRIECLMMGVDPDRETAIIAAKRNAYVITNDSDYFIFPVPGVIHLSALVRGYQTEALSLVPKRVSIIKLDRILLHNNLTYEQYLFAMITRGNDFISPTNITQTLTHQRENLTFGALFALIRNKCPQQTRSEFASLFALCNEGHPEYNEETYLRVAEKYSLSNYPNNPLSYFSDSITDLPPVPQWCVNMLEALQNSITCNQLASLFSDYYCLPITFIHLYDDIILSVIEYNLCNLDSLINDMYPCWSIDLKETDQSQDETDQSQDDTDQSQDETDQSQDESLNEGPPTFSEIMKRLKHTAIIRDKSVEDRLILLEKLLLLPHLELEEIPEENWTLICCLK
ncbi:hypothetical protein WA538_000506 [Blastocystis sp. DL]